MSDTFVTFHGWVGSDIIHRERLGVSVANFRVGSTPRIKRDGKWIDGDTTWYSVSAWRSLADNIRDSVRRGDAVIVHGRLRSESWVREDKQISTTMVVDASFLGHDLTRGTTTFIKSTKPERPESSIEDEMDEIIRGPVGDLTRMDTWGNPIPPVPTEGVEASDAA